MATRVQSKVNVHLSGIEDKFNELINDPATMLEIHTLFAKTIDPWVPYLHGPLSQTIKIEPDCVRYTQPYARRQYYGVDFNHTKDTHPLASALWDKVAMQTQREVFAEQVHEILVRRAHKS